MSHVHSGPNRATPEVDTAVPSDRSALRIAPPAEADANATASVNQSKLDQAIASMLGDEATAFLLSSSAPPPTPCSRGSAILYRAAHIVKAPSQRDAILHLRELYETVVDFEGKLTKPRSSLEGPSSPYAHQVTLPEGESVLLINAALKNVTQHFHEQAHLLTSAREAIELAGAVVAPKPPLSPPSVIHVEIPAIQPQPGPPAEGDASRKERKNYLATLTLGGAWIGSFVCKGLGALAFATARLREIVPSNKSIDRPDTRTALLKRLFDSVVEFDIKGLELLASHALGMLAPRGMAERFAQTGTDDDSPHTAEGESARRKALFKFIIDLRRIRSYFHRNPQIKDGAHWFYCKEPQVLLDREGKFARLDSFLLQTPQGQRLFDAIYQPLSVTSDTEDAHGTTITVPILPLTPTTIPLPPHHFVTCLEYLDAHGDPIEQPEQNALRACVAGGALITAPPEARIVRYLHENINDYRALHEKTAHLPRPLTADEFRSFRDLLPNAAFDLGEEMEIAYEMIREFADPKERIMLAAHLESCRGWSYTTDPLIGTFQHAAGDAFLESVYHSRAGICDSMSAVASYLVGEAIGLPGLVVSGPVAEEEFFDRKVGHSIALGLLPDCVQTLDLTVASRSSTRISGRRVPPQAREALTRALSQSTISRREISNIYQDLGDIIRGIRPTSRFNALPLSEHIPVRLWRDLMSDGRSEPTREHDENFPPSPGDEKARSLGWAVEVIQFDRMMSRCERSRNFDEFGWFLAHKLNNLYFEPPKDPEQITQSWGATERFKYLTQRNIRNEATERLFSLIQNRQFSDNVVRQFPKIAEALSIAHVPRFIQCLREHDYPEAISAKILDRNLERWFKHVRYLAKSGAEVACTIQFLGTVTSSVDYYSARGLPCASKVGEAIIEILQAAKHSGHMKEATLNEVEDLTLALINSLRTMWNVAGSEGPVTLCHSFMNENSAVRGLQILFDRQPELLLKALHLDAKKGRDILTSQVIHSFIEHAQSKTAALSLIRHATEVVGGLDLSKERAMIFSATKRIISSFLKSRSESERRDDPLINWPDDRHPASLLSFISNPKKGGAQALSLLKTLVECNGITPSEAQTLWPRTKERQVAERFIRACDFESGGILTTSEDYEWNLSQLPNLLDAIISQSAPPQFAQTTQEIRNWTRARGELTSLPEEKHFLDMIALLGGIPHEWRFDSQESAIVEALAEGIRGSTSPATLYSALHAVSPYLIAPADEAQADQHKSWLTELARAMRHCSEDGAATELLAQAQRWTNKAPRALQEAIVGCVAACSIVDLASQSDLNLSALTRAIPFKPFTHVQPLSPDDGTSPHTQLWSACFPLETGYPYYSTPIAYEAATIMRDLFKGLSPKTRHTLRSPLLHFTSSERGKIKVSGFARTPESSRQYLRGDDVRSIDWKSSARGDTLMVKVREEREERALTIIADLATLGREISEIATHLRRTRTNRGPALRSLVQGAPHLATLIHEAMVARDNNVRVDLVLTHHTVIRHYPNVAESVVALEQDSDHFWMGIQNDAETAKKFRRDEEELFGPTLFHSGSPLAYGQVEIPRKHLIHFLMGPDCHDAIQRSASFLRARGNLVAFGTLPAFRQS